MTDGPLARYVNLRVAHAPGMPGTFPRLCRLSDPDMHHGTCVTHVPWCLPGSLTIGFLWSRWRGNRSRHSDACATRNSTYLIRGPCIERFALVPYFQPNTRWTKNASKPCIILRGESLVTDHRSPYKRLVMWKVFPCNVVLLQMACNWTETNRKMHGKYISDGKCIAHRVSVIFFSFYTRL